MLNSSTFQHAIESLTARDPDLARIVAEHGAPKPHYREPGFQTLVYTILEQQVSLASAQAVFEKLAALANHLTPTAFLSLDDDQLRGCGFSRQKSRYCRDLAERVAGGNLDIDGLSGLPDESVRTELIRVKGIGPWTADIYLLSALRRPDIWPVGDLALQVAAQQIKHLPARPAPGELETLGEQWRPWRSTAANLLWHWYLSQ